ncbi:GNAT family N-acetyltransferase [Tropicimonas marinistellae]|uniref:GNAT family N-acetyltransferase n=1 Tax=Tropicimonas marinistellae TaxID=1739787 RepID=UPI00098ECC4A|nr:GNAT family N-acetyltransferase [Tropicimonas marinistellae]
MKIRPATADDAAGASRMLQALAAAGKRSRPSDPDFVLETYICAPDRVECLVAVDEDGTILGLQSLARARPGNPYGVAEGWGIIGTHVSPRAARKGCGKALFAVTREAALAAGLVAIDASIGADNADGLAYYAAMGFETYRTPEGKICKRLALGPREAGRRNAGCVGTGVNSGAAARRPE